MIYWTFHLKPWIKDSYSGSGKNSINVQKRRCERLSKLGVCDYVLLSLFFKHRRSLRILFAFYVCYQIEKYSNTAKMPEAYQFSIILHFVYIIIYTYMCAVWTYLCLHTHTTRYFYVWWWKSKYFAYMLLNPTHLIRITLKRRIHLMKHSNGAQNVCKYIFHGKYKICWACEWLSVVTVFCHLYEHKMSIKWMAKVDVIRWKSLYYVQKTF